MHRDPTEAEKEFLAKIGEILLDWNVLEATIELITYRLAGGGNHIDVLTAHLGNVAMTDALKTLANEFGPEDLRDDILHTADLFDRLREYRNYYVHGIRLLAHKGDTSGPIVGLSQSTTAKSRLRLHQAMIGIEDLQKLDADLVTAKRFADWIVGKLWGVEELPGVAQPSQPPEKPPLPDRLKKPVLFLLDVSRSPQASQE
ncbi:hypothetical protein GFL21_33195 [Rhizobium anhuiense]|uniref:hypothetical protein n=1 Tax=Rhizobium anhuiense TaxID=1184720 RepID=UPI0014412E04|nr:hypothetical protein [Rhizobium anhuiense]NKM59274.1 hypothetical protein [Rhizobium anhuiense]